MVWGYFFFLLWFIYLIVSSILLFSKGFLLSRDSLEVNSTCVHYTHIPCTDTKDSITISEQNTETCSVDEKLEEIISNINTASKYCLPPRAKVLLIIIDALRYDFTLFDESIKNPLPFQNKLPIMRKTLDYFPERSRLYKFLADPPTTTMQRLKALTTGSLPTFIDAGSNFASYEIGEDNIIDQAARNNLSIVFMGDDTWGSLYPGRFHRIYPFPSFDVWDLDTVDQGNLQHLYPELQKNDWNLLVAHFLGVDHAGHRYGPNHREMGRKLTEMNEMLGNVMENMSNDTILYVMGDHGMTSSGDHGGETENEITSALFVYSKFPLAAAQGTTAVKQVNIVPTIATVLGVPIPFSNLGMLIIDALPVLTHTYLPQWQLSTIATWSNVEQVVDYLRQYSIGVFDSDKLKNVFEKFGVLQASMLKVNNDASFEEFYGASVNFVGDIRKMYEQVWVEFDSFSITRGLLLLFLSLFFTFILMDGVPANYIKELFLSSFLTCSYFVVGVSALLCLVLYYFDVINNLISSVFFAGGVSSQVMFAMLVVQNWDTISLNWYSKSRNDRLSSCVSRFALAFTLICLFSNSYIEQEAAMSLFLLMSFFLFSLFWLCSNGRKGRYKLLLISFCACVILRLSVNYWRCREEQGICFTEQNQKEATKTKWIIALASLAGFVTFTKSWLKNCGSLNGFSFTVTLIKYTPTIMVVCTGGYWVLHKVPFDQSWKADHLVWVVYGVFIMGVAYTCFQPLMIYLLPTAEEMNSGGEDVVPRLFRKVKGLLSDKGKSEDGIPVIYGLATVFSSVYVAIAVYFIILFSLLLNESSAPAACVMFLSAAFLLAAMSAPRIATASTIDELFEVPNMSVMLWALGAHNFFYATGHHAAWSNIDWNAAFIGTTGFLSHNYIRGALVLLNTFSSYIFFGFTVPLLTIAPFTLFVMAPTVFKKSKELTKETTNMGELLLFEKSESLLTSVLVISCKYLACHAIRVFVSMLAATVHCRHLMAWKLFAPKFIFEGIGMFATSISVLLGYLILVRIKYTLDKFIKELNEQNR